MRLAKLTLSGFKSFADHTEFTFDHAVTGVVGPNGCGKSNIVDAIKWVLGERSSKSLRGTEMIDVIFAGSAGRKPAGMASVKLTFENPVIERGDDAVPTIAAEENPSLQDPGEAAGQVETAADAPTEDGVADSAPTVNAAALLEEDIDTGSTMIRRDLRRRRALPIDTDIVEIERRLYRDGASKYLINGRTARLRDIRELFLDTGIGADAYSIIEQGKVDAMLLASPQERRTIFEEAAGIARYKQRRIESERKLDRAETNLKSTREQLDNTERRLRIVRGQAAKARKFKELDEQLAAWRAALAFEQYDELEQRLLGLTSRQEDLSQQRDESGRLLGELETAKQEAELARHELADQHKGLEQELLTAQHTQQQATQRRGMLERSIEEASRQTAADKARLEDLEQRGRDTETAIADQKESIAAMGEQLAESDRRLQQAGTARAGVLEELNERRRALSEKNAAVSRIDRERIQITASVQADIKRADSIREQIANLADKAGRIESESATVAQNTQAAQAAAAAATEQVASLEAELKSREEQTGRLGADRKARAERASTLEQDLVRADSRRATLQEMVETRAGFAESVRKVLEMREAGEGFAGIIAPLADLVEIRAEVDADAAAAVETALGADLQGLVVRAFAEIPSRDELAKLPGRVAFLPLGGKAATAEPLAVEGVDAADPRSRVVSLRSLVKGRVAPTDATGVEGLEGEGASIDPAAEQIDQLLDRLLADAVLVSDLDAALMLAAGPMRGRRTRFVTRDGAVLDSDGRVFAGPATADADAAAGGLLRRRAELEQLSHLVDSLRVQLDSERTALKAVDEEAAAITAQAGQLRSQIAQQQRIALTEQNRLERLNADAARLTRDRHGLEQETRTLSERLAKLDADRASLEERASSLRRLQDEEAAAAAEMDAEIRKIQMRADAAQEQMTQAKVEVSRLTEQASAARRELSRLEVSRDEIGRHTRDVTAQLARLESRLVEHKAAIDEAAAQIEQAAAQIETLRTQIGEIETTLGDATVRVSELAEKVQAARQQFQALERDWHSLEVSRRECEVKRENLEERTQQEIAIDLKAEYADYRAMIEPGDVARVDVAEATSEIEALRDAIKKLGNVNLDALNEETNLEQQNENLIRQVADLDEARIQLTDLITRLNQVSRERFGEVFTKIQKNFGESDGMFRKLFGGGKAEVRLMPLIKEVENPDGSISKVETDQTDLLESGIEVIAKPPGKEPRSISQLSGGEKTLTAVALLMSIFRSKPSCFCVLDEVDAALDEGNVGRFNGVVRQFTDLSHFIVITHNKRTMQNTDHLYGVTMQERGVSTRVAVRFEDVGKDGEIRRSQPAKEEAREAELVGASNGHTNGHTNGHANGHTNGDTQSESRREKSSVRAALAALRESEEPNPALDN